MRTLLSAMMVGALFILAGGSVAAQGGSGPSFQDFQKEVESVGNIDVSVTSKGIAVAWQGIAVGPNVSAWLRDKLDGITGDEQDGNVSEDEAEAAETLLRHFVQQEFNSYAHDERLSGYLMIDRINPQGAEVTALVATGVEGPVAQEDGIGMSFVARIAFPTRAADVHTVKLDMGRYYFHAVNESKAAEIVGDFTLTVRGGNGWAIDVESIQPDCAADKFDAESGAMVFTVDDVNCFTGRTGVLLGFMITGSDETPFTIPGPGLPLAVLSLVGLGVVLRRRK